MDNSEYINFNLKEELKKLEMSNADRAFWEDKICDFCDKHPSGNCIPGRGSFTVYIYLDPKGKPYIGKAKEPTPGDSIRAMKHRAGKNGSSYKTQPVWEAFAKYGYNNCLAYGLAAGLSKATADRVEGEAITFFGSKQNGYNGNSGFHGNLEEFDNSSDFDNGEPTISIIDVETEDIFCVAIDVNDAVAKLGNTCQNIKALDKAVYDSIRKKRVICRRYLCVSEVGLTHEKIKSIIDEVCYKGCAPFAVYYPTKQIIKTYKSPYEAAEDSGLSIEVIKNRLSKRTQNITDGVTPYVSYNLENIVQEYEEQKEKNVRVYCLNLVTNARYSAQSPQDLRKILWCKEEMKVSEDCIQAGLRENTTKAPFSTLAFRGTLYIRSWKIFESAEEIMTAFEAKGRHYLMYNAVTMEYEGDFFSQKQIAAKLNLNHSTVSNGIKKNRINEHLVYEQIPSREVLKKASQLYAKMQKKHDRLCLIKEVSDMKEERSEFSIQVELRNERDRLLEILRVLPEDAIEAKRLIGVRLSTIKESLEN